MVKYMAVLFSVLVYNVYAGNTLACVKAEIDNGDAKAVAEYIAGKAVPKLLANNNVEKFMKKTHLAATQNEQGGYDFSLLGVPVASSDAQPNAATLVSQLVPHIATALVTAKATSATAAASSSSAASSGAASSSQA